MNSEFEDTSVIKGALRQVARYSKQKKIALERARDWTQKGPRGGAMYTCVCGCGSYPGNRVQVDHIEPVVPVDRELSTWDEYIERLFCSPDKLQVMFKECHLIKSKAENELRSKYKRSL